MRISAVGLLRIVAIVAAAVLLGACDDEFPDYRYRMTVEVYTPEGPRTGSSVVEVETRGVHTIQDSSGRSFRTTFHGEAVAVDVAEGRTLFALMGSPNDPDYAESAAHWALKPERTTGPDLRGYAEHLRQMMEVKGPHDLPRNHWPLLVTFLDADDPASVQEVKEGNVSKLFGAGTYVSRITIELTNDDRTSGIEKRFSWWDRHQYLHFDGSSAILEDLRTTRLAARLSSRSFSTEVAD